MFACAYYAFFFIWKPHNIRNQLLETETADLMRSLEEAQLHSKALEAQIYELQQNQKQQAQPIPIGNSLEQDGQQEHYAQDDTNKRVDMQGQDHSNLHIMELENQLVRTQEAAAKEIRQLHSQVSRLSDEKLSLERAMLKQSSHVSTIEHELELLQQQLQTESRNQAQINVPGDSPDSVRILVDSSRETSNGRSVKSEGKYGITDRKMPANVVVGLANCLSLVTDRKLSERSAMAYLIAMHCLFLVVSVHCFAF